MFNPDRIKNKHKLGTFCSHYQALKGQTPNNTLRRQFFNRFESMEAKEKKKFLKIIALSCYFRSFPTAEGFLKICPIYDSQVQSSFYKTGY